MFVCADQLVQIDLAIKIGRRSGGTGGSGGRSLCNASVAEVRPPQSLLNCVVHCLSEAVRPVEELASVHLSTLSEHHGHSALLDW